MNSTCLQRWQRLHRIVEHLLCAAVCLFLLSVPVRASSPPGPNGINIGFDFNWNSGPAGYTASFISSTSGSGSTLSNCAGRLTSSARACNFVFSYNIDGVAQTGVASGGVYDTWPSPGLSGNICEQNPSGSAPLTLFNCFNNNSFGEVFMPGATGTLSNFTMSMTCLNPAGGPISGAVALLYEVNSDGISLPSAPIAQAPLDLSSCPTLTSWAGHKFNAADFAPIPMNFAHVTLTAGKFYGVYFAYPLQWLTVTTLADQTNDGATCTGGTTCSLRDAITRLNAENAGAITGISFQSGLTGTIHLNSGLTIKGNALIQGPGANLITVSGGGTASNFSVFTINGGVGLATISGLTIANGSSPNGGAILNSGGMLSVANSAFTNNSATAQGGAIFNNNGGALTLTNSTFSGNSAANEGGAIYNNGVPLAVTNSTFSGNSSTTDGGAVYNINDAMTVNASTFSGNSAEAGGGIYNSSGLLAIANSIVSGNMANGAPNDIDGGAYTDQGGNVLGYADGAAVSTGKVNLSIIGNYGGTTQTMVPLPGSPALCAGLSANIPSGVTNDQRGAGFSRTNSSYTGYSATNPCLDTGAVQTSYALGFTTEPAEAYVGSAMTPPVVTLTESGTPASFVASGTVSISDSDSHLNRTSTASIMLSSGTASFDNLLFATTDDSDSLTATLPLTGSIALTANSSTFAISPARIDTTSTSVSFSPTSAVYGQPITIIAKVTDTTTGHTTQIPTGFVKLVDTLSGKSSSLESGNTIILVNGSATLTGVLLDGLGTHSIQASYKDADEGYIASSGSNNIVISVATPALSGPTGTVQVVFGQTGSVPVSVTGPYSGAGINQPGGSVIYSLVNSSGKSVESGTAAISSGAASIPLTNTLASGSYTLQLSYTGDGNYGAAASITAGVHVGADKTTIRWQSPSAIAYGTNLSAALNAQAMNGSTALPATSVYTAVSSKGTSVAVTASSVLPAGTYTLNVTITPTDSGDYTPVSGSAVLTVNQVTPSVALQSSANPVMSQNPVTLVATVSSAVSTPTGTVTFYNGTTALGSAVSLDSSGVAKLITTSLASGADSITAVYSGDTNFVSGTSSSVAESVEDFNLAMSSAQGSVTSTTVVPGQTASYSLLVSPQAPATTFSAPISLSITGLPAGATAAFSPSALTAGSSATPVTLSIQVPSQPIANGSLSGLKRTGIPVALSMLFLPFAARMRRTSGRLRKIGMTAVIVMALAGSIFGLTGCGGKASGFFSQSPQTYNLTVTAASGALTHSTNIKLTVE